MPLTHALWVGANIRGSVHFGVYQDRIILNPNAPGERPATAKAANIELNGISAVSCLVSAPYKASAPIRFAVRVVDFEGRIVGANSVTVNGGSHETLTVEFPPSAGRCGVEIETNLEPETTTTWAHAHIYRVTAHGIGQTPNFDDVVVLNHGVVSTDVSTSRPPSPLPSDAQCNICGSRRFARASSGRLSRFNTHPMCLECNSLERNRLIRLIYEQIPAARLKAAHALQFSGDNGVAPESFASLEITVYGKLNSIDMMSISRRDGQYDWIVANHVLEHIADDKVAVSELLRVLSPDGVIQLTFPDPIHLLETLDWGYADPLRNDHFRLYGSDFPRRLLGWYPQVKCLQVIGRDPVTGVNDIVYFISRSLPSLEPIATAARAMNGVPLLIA